MNYATSWELPFGDQPELELYSEWGSLTLVPVEPGQSPRLELTHGSAGTIGVHVERVGAAVRVGLEPAGGFNWFGSWDCRATVYVPPTVRASVQTNAGSISVRDLDGCELGIKANAGKIDLAHVHGFLRLRADAGSVSGRDVAGYFDVETQAGSVRLEITDLQPGEHRIRAAMGSVRLELARGLEVCIETRSSLGSVRNSFPSRQNAAARLLLSTEMGSLRIEEGSFPNPNPNPNPNPSPSPGPRPRRDAPREPVSTPPGAAGMPPGAAPTTPPPSGPRPEAASQPPAHADQADQAAPGDPELERILKMVEAGELSAQDADELLRAMGRV